MKAIEVISIGHYQIGAQSFSDVLIGSPHNQDCNCDCHRYMSTQRRFPPKYIEDTFQAIQSKGWGSGESARLLPMWPGFKSQRRRHMWGEFVVGSLLWSERFFSGYSGFPLSSKTNISKFQFDQESGRRRTTLWMCSLQIIIYIFIYLLTF